MIFFLISLDGVLSSDSQTGKPHFSFVNKGKYVFPLLIGYSFCLGNNAVNGYRKVDVVGSLHCHSR